ncbi:MAG: hypothetical protein ACF8Q5_05490 [Phycisphaerales bacterium JB040]
MLVDDLGWQDTSVPMGERATALNRRWPTGHVEADPGEARDPCALGACVLRRVIGVLREWVADTGADLSAVREKG